MGTLLGVDMKPENTKNVFINGIEQFFRFLILIIVSIFTAFPFIWMVISSLKTKKEIMDVAVLFPPNPKWGNFLYILTKSPIPKYIFNSFAVTILIVSIQIITGAMITYAIVFLKFKGRHTLFAIIMGTYMLPVAATYIPSYIILANWNLLNHFSGLVISSRVSIFGIFLLRQSFMQIPKGLVEAARMDGGSNFRILWEIVCPMTKSSFITFGLMSFISTYNNYMWPSLITNDENKYMVSQGIRSFFIEGGAYGTKWQLVMAGSAVIVIPLLIMFAFTQKWFINGIGGDTGMKG